ncbi:DNA internalization-related competence protein ComEC/Rec2 [Loigolactobacillus jiayinensis]|uniref:DNA internalization-related competence protein ComEC/Rec2 n=1 Tax=Loigolactobacillus jiayinensis TaxID=2486016 RepID=A0ABW1RDV5_9LACO|nr:DNA internalization-related competence protein ComEC/Rec2 [Loigolactobacillus jiayinensis]
MRNNWIFLASLAMLLSFAILSTQWWAWLFVLLIVLRLFFTKRWRLIGVTLCLALLFAAYDYYYQKIKPPMPQSYDLLINPDDCTVSGDQLRLTASVAGTRQRVQAYYYLPDQQAQHYWQRQHRAVKLTVSGDYQVLRPATNEAEFDYATYLRQQKRIFYSLNIDEIEKIQLQPATFLIKLHEWRQQLILRSAVLPQQLGQYYRSLILGFQDADFKSTGALFKQLGLIHLFSLSGLHVYYFANLLQHLLLRLRWTRERVELTLLLLLPLYALFAGATTSLLRAALLCWLHIFNRHFHLQVAALDCFAVVVLVNLLYRPYLFFSLGGQLSYLLSFALLFLQKANEWQRALRLNLLSLPLLLYHVYEWHWLTILLNLLIMPIFSYAILPLTLIGSLTYRLLPVIGQIINFCFVKLQIGLSWFARPSLMLTYGRLPPLLASCCILILFFAWCGQHRRYYYLLLGGIYLAGFCWLHFPLQGRVVFFDIGQGDSILIETPFHREVTLIDTGGKLHFGQAAWQQKASQTRAEQVTIPYLKSHGIRRIDHLFLSHQDADHIGDLPAILKQIQVGEVYFPAGMEHNQHFQQRIWPYRMCTKWRPLLRGDTTTITDFACQVLAPRQPGSGTNEDSLVLRLQLNGKTWLFTGDLPATKEADLVPDTTLQADYLKAGHHGSRTSSSATFLAAVQPQRVIISAGRDNRYGHPHGETLARFKAAGIPYANTADSGMIIWNFDNTWHDFLD